MKKKIIIRSKSTNKKICSFKIESSFYKDIQKAAKTEQLSFEDFVIKCLQEHILKSYIE